MSRGVARIFFWGRVGGTPRPCKGYHAPPQWLRGAKAPWTVAKFHLLKRCKVLENESIFKNINIFLAKTTFSLRKISKIKHILQELLRFSENYLLYFNFLEDSIKREKVPTNSNTQLRNLSKKLKKDY